MPDEIVGRVEIEVHGDTRPLKQDIRTAAKDIGHDIGTGVTDGVEQHRGDISDKVADTVAASAGPAEQEGNKVGRAVIRGIGDGIDRDSDRIVTGTRRAGEKGGESLSAGLKTGMLRSGGGLLLAGGMKAMLVPAAAGAVRAVGPLLLGLTSQIGAVSTGFLGMGAVGVGAMTSILPAIQLVKASFKSMNKEQKKAFEEAMKPAKKVFDDVKKNVVDTLIPSLQKALGTLSTSLGPALTKLGDESAKTVGRLVEMFATMAAGRKEDIGTIFAGSADNLGRLGTVIINFADVAINAFAALQPMATRFFKSLEAVSGRLADSLNKGIDTGKFGATMERWEDAARRLWHIFGNLATAAVNFFKSSAGASADLLKSIERMTARWATFAKSVEGQNKFRQMFEDAVPVVEEVWGLLGDIAKLFGESFTGDTGNLLGFVKNLREELIPVLERIQDVVRESGLQDALYDLLDAILSLAEAGGGNMMTLFITALTEFMNIITGILSIPGLSTLAPTLLSIFAAFKVYKGISGIGASLSDFAAGLGKAAGAAAGGGRAAGAAAAGGVADGVGAVFAGGGKGGRALGAARSFGTKLVGGVGKAVPAIAALSLAGAIADPILEGFRQAYKGADELSSAIEDRMGELGRKGSKSLTTLTEGILNSSGRMTWSGPMNSLDTMSTKLHEMDIGVNRFLDSMWTLIPGTRSLFEGVEDDLAGVAQMIENTANVDPDRALEFYYQLEDSLKRGGASAEEVESKIGGVKDAIEDAIAAGKPGIDLKMDISSTTAAIETFGQTFDTEIQRRLDALTANAFYVNVKTGALTSEGWAERKTILLEADFTSLNGIKNAIDDVTANEIRNVYLNPEYTDEFGNLTKKGIEIVARLSIKGVEIKETELAALRERIQKMVGLELGGVQGGEKTQYGRQAAAAYLEDKGAGLTGAQKTAFGERILAYRMELLDKGKTEDEIATILQAESKQIKMDILKEDAKGDLDEVFGDWENKLKYLTLGINAQGLDKGLVTAGGKLIEFTKDGKWSVVIGAEARTEAAEEVLFDTANKERLAKFFGTADIEGAVGELDDAAKERLAVFLSDAHNVKKVDQLLDDLASPGGKERLAAFLAEADLGDVSLVFSQLTSTPYVANILGNIDLGPANSELLGFMNSPRSADIVATALTDAAGEDFTILTDKERLAEVLAKALTGDAEGQFKDVEEAERVAEILAKAYTKDARTKLDGLEDPLFVTVTVTPTMGPAPPGMPKDWGNWAAGRMLLPPPSDVADMDVPSMLPMGAPNTLVGSSGGAVSMRESSVGQFVIPMGIDRRRNMPTYNVSITNNYPEPERASDSLAMSLRLARYAMAG